MLLFFFTTGSHFAQGGFKKKYFPVGSLSSACGNVFETPNGNFIALGVTVDTINNQQVQLLTIIGTDALGNQLWKKSYGNANLRYYATFEQGFIDSTGIYQAVGIQDPSLRAIGGLVKFNFQGDTIWQKIYRDSNPLDDVIPTSINQSTDGSILITGFFQNWGTPAYRKILLIKTDKFGNELWRKKISGTAANWQSVACGFGITQDIASKRIFISGYQYLGAGPTVFSSYGSVFCTDSLGNTLWQKAFSNQGSNTLRRVIEISSGKYLAVGANATKYDSWGFATRWQATVLTFDIDGNEIWSKPYDCEGYSNVLNLAKKTSANEIILAGGVDTSTILNWSGSDVITMLAIDTNGVLKRAKAVGSAKQDVFGTEDYAVSLFQTKDKGFVLATQMPSLPGKKPYSILKLDSTFCDTLEAYCRSVELGINEFQNASAKFAIFPNPSNAQITVEINVYQEQALAVLLYDLSGRLVKQAKIDARDKIQMDVSDLENGIYVLQIFSDEKSLGIQKLLMQK